MLIKILKTDVYKSLTLHFAMEGCGTWSLTLREEQKLKVIENRVLRGIFGRNREEAVGGWRRLHNEELHDLYAPVNIIRVIK
jgi:hypothetical protein